MSTKVFLRKVHKRIFERIVGRLFFESRWGIFNKPTRYRRAIRDFNQKLNEKGTMAPWIYKQEECSAFWKTIDNEHASRGNRPTTYSQKNTSIVPFLHKVWSPEITPTDHLLELGCNAGANLNAFLNLGYTQLSGIEINVNAITELKRAFPNLSDVARILNGSGEEILPTLPSNSVDVTYTMAVSMHIPPKSNHLFNEMIRVSRKYVCMLESEVANANYIFARNYERVFTSRGCKQVKSYFIDKQESDALSRYHGFMIRLFRVPS